MLHSAVVVDASPRQSLGCAQATVTQRGCCAFVVTVIKLTLQRHSLLLQVWLSQM